MVPGPARNVVHTEQVDLVRGGHWQLSNLHTVILHAVFSDDAHAHHKVVALHTEFEGFQLSVARGVQVALEAAAKAALIVRALRHYDMGAGVCDPVVNIVAVGVHRLVDSHVVQGDVVHTLKHQVAPTIDIFGESESKVSVIEAVGDGAHLKLDHGCVQQVLPGDEVETLDLAATLGDPVAALLLATQGHINGGDRRLDISMGELGSILIGGHTVIFVIYRQGPFRNPVGFLIYNE